MGDQVTYMWCLESEYDYNYVYPDGMYDDTYYDDDYYGTGGELFSKLFSSTEKYFRFRGTKPWRPITGVS